MRDSTCRTARWVACIAFVLVESPTAMARPVETEYSRINVPARLLPYPDFFGMTARGRARRQEIIAALIVVVAGLSSRQLDAAYARVAPSTARDLSTLMGPRLTSRLDWWSRDVAIGKSFELYLDASMPVRLGAFQVATRRSPWLSPLHALGFEPEPRWVSNLCWHVDVNEIPEFADTASLPAFLKHDSLDAMAQTFGPILNPFGTSVEALPSGLGPLLQAPKPAAAPVQLRQVCPHWRLPQPVSFAALAGEGDRFPLVDCAGTVLVDALDRLSVIARLPGSARPALPLPLTPQNNLSFDGEWVAGVHLLHPRLLGLVQRIALAFPHRTISVYSGYRRDRRPTSPHVRGRALDLAVQGIQKESLFAFCRTLPNAGCGYYPNQPFVHVDVRDESQGSVGWVDVSLPGRPSVYAEIWPKPESGSASPEPE